MEADLARLQEQLKADSIAAAGGDEFAESPIDPKLYQVSALTGEGMDSLKAAIAQKVHELREEAREAAGAQEQDFDKVWRLARERRDGEVRITREEDALRVEGRAIERMTAQTDLDNEEALIFLQHRFRRSGLDEALREAGARDGDEIRIGDFAFEYIGDAEDGFEELDI